jgi:hypothetical protein
MSMYFIAVGRSSEKASSEKQVRQRETMRKKVGKNCRREMIDEPKQSAATAEVDERKLNEERERVNLKIEISRSLTSAIFAGNAGR